MAQSKALLHLIPVVCATAYIGFVVVDRFRFHEEAREEKLRKKRERQALEVAAARAGLPSPTPQDGIPSSHQNKKFSGW